MARQDAIILEEQNLRIPENACTYDGFQSWVESADFPENGRIDYLKGDVEIDMSPEDLHTHGAPKAAITAALHHLIAGRVGEVFVDSTRVTSRFVALSVEPDVVVVLWEALKSGRVRYVPAAVLQADRYSGIEGAPDVVVEVVSDGSQNKDLKRLPLLYAQAGIPELWLVDARRNKVKLQIQALRDGQYAPVEQGAEGWVRSPRLGFSFRLVRSRTPVGTWYFVLEHRPD